MLLRAFAKINLELRILGRRRDGYHEIQTILQTIDWWDEIHLHRADRFQFSGPGTPEDETNLVVRAVRAYERISRSSVPVEIRLVKNIPVGRGLGGGSADAAVTLMGLQRLFKRSIDPAEVSYELRQLGSDVPFFTIGGKAEATGRGDEVGRLDDDTDYWLVVVDPGVHIPTVEAYSWLTVSDKSHTIEGFRTQPGNDFEVPVFKRYPGLAEIRDQLIKLGAFRAALSGSGSAIFGQFHAESDAGYAEARLADRFAVRVTKPLPRLEYFQRMAAADGF
jgi:4-diphosphocytidyl-2-C-methyl-D-erythritol kinase